MQSTNTPTYNVQKRKGSPNWSVYFRLDGKPYMKAIPASAHLSEKAALKAAQPIIDKAVEEAEAKSQKMANARNYPSWEAAVTEWIRSLGLISEATREQYQDRRLPYFYKKTGVAGPAELDEAAAWTAINHFEGLVRLRERQPKYWAAIRAAVVKFLDWAVGKGYCKKNWVRDSTAPSPSTFKRHDHEIVWSDTELMAIRRNVPKWAAETLSIIRYTGMDPADIGSLARRHVRVMKGGLMIVKPRKKEARHKDAMIKLPIYDDVRGIFEKAYADAIMPDDLLFPKVAQFTALGRNDLNERVRRAWPKLWPGTKPKNPKALRHTFITWAIEVKKVPLPIVQDFVGHTRRSTILADRYLHIEDTFKYLNGPA